MNDKNDSKNSEKTQEKDRLTALEALEKIEKILEPWKLEQIKRGDDNLVVDDNVTRTLLFFNYFYDIVKEHENKLERLDERIEDLEAINKKLRKKLKDNNLWITDY